MSGSKQAQVAEIYRSIDLLDTKDVHTILKWILAHAGVEGNERADTAAKEITKRSGGLTRTRSERQREVEGLIKLINEDID